MRKITAAIFLILVSLLTISSVKAQDETERQGVTVTVIDTVLNRFAATVPEDWLATETAKPRYEISITTDESKRTCEYINWSDITVIRYNADVTITDLRTNEVLATRRFHAPTVNCPSSLTDSKRSTPSSVAFAHWLNLNLDGIDGLSDFYTYRVMSSESSQIMEAENRLFAKGNNLSADGRYAGFGHRNDTATIWNTTTLTKVMTLEGHSNNVSDVSFSPDGRYIVTASWDETARIWDAATGEQISVLDGHTDIITSVGIGSDGHFVVTASTDETTRMWDVATGEEILALEGHTGSVADANFSPDGRYIVTASRDETARIWDAATGASVQVLRGHDAQVNGGLFSPDSLFVVTASDDATARVWSVETGEEVLALRGHTSSVASVDYRSDGGYIVTGSYDNTAWIWDAASGEPVTVLFGIPGAVTHAQFTPDGRFIVTASNDESIRVWPVFSDTSATGLPPVCAGIVTVHMYGGAATTSDIVHSFSGTRVAILGRSGSWYRAQIDRATEGWISSELLEVYGPDCDSLSDE